MPSSFLPDEDQGYAYVNLQLPNGASLERTSQSPPTIENILANTPGVKYTTSVIGFSLLSFVRTSYNAFFVVTLKPWDERTSQSRAVSGDQGASESAAEQIAGRNRVQFFAAGHSGRWHRRRIHLHPRRPFRRQHPIPVEKPEHVSWKRHESGRRSPA